MDAIADGIRNLARRDPVGATSLLIEQCHERIYAFLRRLCGSDADAEDLTQQTFVRVQRALPSFAGRSSASSWVHGIAYHVFQDWRRARRPLGMQPDDWWAECVGSGSSPDETASAHDLAQHLYRSVDSLDPDLRDAVHLHYYQGLTLDETAQAMNIATSTVKYRLRRALEVLQRALADERISQ